MTETLSSNVPVSGPRIRTLAGVLSNQIAAGEVIERPASVVKELIENSFDAAARRIQIEVEAGGVALVRVRDDGCGIHAEDLKLALSRHATSKIASLSDLERVNSFGFRGEALPSIASVSRLTLASRAAQSDSGFEVVAEGSAADTLRPVALPPGTLVSVRDLFFNTPARRKFLRTERTEFRHLEDVVKRAALCRFDVALSFLHNGKEILRLSPALEPGARSTRVGRLLGQAFAENALEVDIEGPGMTLAGWVGVPEAARAHTDMQYFFINGRAVRDSTARHAVRQALGERLPPGRHPAYVLYLDLDPYQVDVNVHPAKHEVRFREPRLVHDFLWRGLARALEEPNSFSFVGGAVSRMPAQTPGNANDAVPPSRLAPGQERELAEPGAVYRRSGDSGAKLARTPQPHWGPSMAESRLIIAQRYALRAVAGRVAIVDLAETRHAMILQRLGPTLEQGDDISRPLLLPLSVSVKASCADRLEAKFELLAGAGFDLRRSAPAAVTLRAVPACLAHAPASAVFETIIHWIEAGAGAETKTLVEALARTAGERLEDLADDPEAVAALVHFASAHPVEARPRLMLELDASIVADLLRR